MTIGARDLRRRLAEILDQVEKGGEVSITRHGRVVAILVPAEKVDRPFSPIGQGIWADNADVADVEGFIGQIRENRFDR